jgi:succinate dehydrogenase (ubiquinone) cytochrome b560 subunit
MSISRKSNMAKSLGANSFNFSTAESYTDRQAKLGRPVSPHLTIYRSTISLFIYVFPWLLQCWSTQTMEVTKIIFSPHRFPIAATTSIMNRITGVALSVGITGVGAVSLIGGDVPALASLLGSITVVGPIVKFAAGFPLIYHYFGAVRHAMWDRIPESTLTTDEVTRSSYILLGSSLAASIGFAFVSF